MTKQQVNKIGKEAIIPNERLLVFSKLLGEWETTGNHPLMQGVILHGRTSFEWIEGGAFLLMRTEINEPGIPSGISIIGSDNKLDECYMLYFDERGVSRKYEIKMDANIWKWWRNEQNFSQRFTGTIIDQGNKIIGKGEICKDNENWEQDLNLDYIRISTP